MLFSIIYKYKVNLTSKEVSDVCGNITKRSHRLCRCVACIKLAFHCTL